MLILLQTPLVNHLIWYFELCAVFSAISLILLHTLFNEAPFVPDDEKIILDSEVLKSEKEEATFNKRLSLEIKEKSNLIKEVEENEN